MRTHGMYGTSEYHSWFGMIQRCSNSNNIGFKNYMDRGISVCERWKNSFQAFYQDMGEKPFPEASIERRDNDEGYTPENCYWASKKTQAINQRIRKDNKSGYKGVSWHKKINKWQSHIKYNCEQIHIGYYSTPEEAAIARDEYILENELSEYTLQVLPEP